MRLMHKIPHTQLDDAVDYTTTEIIEYSDRWVIAHRDNISISVTSGLLEISEDNSLTFIRSLPIPNADKIINGYIFRNGNIMLTTIDNKIFLTNQNLDFYEEKIVYRADGVTPYPIHTPQNSAYPGRYFYTHKYMAQTEETDVYVFGNYCSVNYGAAPVIIVYTADFGQNFKIAYEFGQLYRDDGTETGSKTTGTLLGDPNNSLKTRHTHHVEYSPFNDKWYCFTGDFDEIEIHWLEGTYNSNTDVWVWGKINFNTTITKQSRLKSTEMFFLDEWIYYSTDATDVTSTNNENGIWRVRLNEIADISKHEKVIDFPNYDDVASNIKYNEDSGNIVFSIIPQNSDGNTKTLGVATDAGKGEVHYKTFEGMNFIRLNSPNSAGFFRLDTDRFSTLQDRSFLIKVGYDLFGNL